MRNLILGLCAAAFFAAPGAHAGGASTDPATAVNAFAVDLYRRLAAPDENLFFSPASASVALAMTRLGADGATAAEMDRVLHFAPDDPLLASAFGRFAGQLAVDPEFAVLRLANRLFGQSGLPFRRDYLATLQEHFDAGLEQVDFRRDAEGARRLINTWVEQQTEDRIKDLLADGDVGPSTALVLVNAVYFLGSWQQQFPMDATFDDTFHRADGTEVTVPFMHLDGALRWGRAADAQVLALPYKGNGLEMVLVLPDEGTTLADLDRGLDAGRLASWLAAPMPRAVEAAVPRLHLETSFDLTRALADLGMTTAFGARADFSGMIDGGGLAIDRVVHKAFLDVDEKGTEAAAATGVVMRVTSARPVDKVAFTADRPFLLAIRHVDTGAVLFLGRVADPS
ncbi:MAG TPA: serpin family protein [Candidatus Krumholzibacteria bacterium]|nr:serpin family protein [Candidatus Krumholzibacteria bacterium]